MGCGRSGPRAAAVFLLLSAGVATAAEPGACAAPAAFSENPLELIASAADLASGESRGTEILRRLDTYQFDDIGRATHRQAWLWRVGAEGFAGGAKGWDAIEATWQPTFQSLERVRGRVIDPDGTVREVVVGDESTRWDTEAETELAGTTRSWRIPLPDIRPGSLVEEEIVVRDVRRFSMAGRSYRYPLALAVPVARGCLVLEAPLDLPLRHGVRGKKGLVVAQSVLPGSMTRLRFEANDPQPTAQFEAGLPVDQPRVPMVVFSTGESWAEVAAVGAAEGGAESVAGNHQGAAAADLPDSVEALITALGLSEEDRQVRPRYGPQREVWIRRALAAVRAKIDLTPTTDLLGTYGVERPTAVEILTRGRGDSFDLATVLVAALKAAEVSSEVALVRRGPGLDIEPELPGLGLFDHALVYLPGKAPRWIDPADRFTRVGELGSSLQGRRALVLSTSTRELVSTPDPRSGDNRVLVRIDVYLADEGPARIVETSRYRGALEHRQRRFAATLDRRTRHLGYLDYLRSAYRAEGLGDVEETDADDLSTGYRLRLEALDASRGFTAEGEAAFAFVLHNLIALLPRELLPPAGLRRQGRFQFHEPLVAEWSIRIFPPQGLRPVDLPQTDVRALGTGQLRREFREEEGVVFATFRLESGPALLEPEVFEKYRRAVEDILVEEPLVLFFAIR